MKEIGQVLNGTRTFCVEPIAEFFGQAPACYDASPGMNRLSHASRVEQCFHFWKLFWREEGFEMIYYNSKVCIPARFPG